jgi:hypothetical protein
MHLGLGRPGGRSMWIVPNKLTDVLAAYRQTERKVSAGGTHLEEGDPSNCNLPFLLEYIAGFDNSLCE